MESPDISVYAEAKGEYTHQLCVFLIPPLESYVLELLEQAKRDAPNPQKVLWQFQTILQDIPEWNHDKVIRETEKIQKDCNCDYMDELLTAVFIAHTKVLSAIRLTTRQKDIQLTLPTMDHFLHRVLSECARSLWTNAYLFADTNSIDKQKNFRQVSSLLNDSILQAIRGLLPVKKILREYLHDDESQAGQPEDKTEQAEEKEDNTDKSEETVEKPEGEKEETTDKAEGEKEETAEKPEGGKEETTDNAEGEKEETAEKPEGGKEETTDKAEEKPIQSEEMKPQESPADNLPPAEAPVINIDTKPSVTFSNNHVIFDPNNLEANEIQDIPFIDEDEEITIGDEIMPIDSDELI